ncbi:hypothetical protein HCN44_006787 [Aphidius gifuensis]|uniref:Peptide deformylase n=1 Tax=Aphidius gifuensis TaxID=684658 RepID=A0A834Y0S8_APHGI|nr:peptide deformylase, mitochondrial-like [Aphidius gifuensis]KAF7995680.1 hypothetical protein HCN44_006787 [Aphidius gifuensis]
MMFKRTVSLCCLRNKILFNDSVRYNSNDKIENWITNKLQPRYEKVKPPYDHVCQVGDPVLRVDAGPVDPKIIPTVEFKKNVDLLIKTMRRYGAYGLAAPQIGLSLQLFAMETTKAQLDDAVQSKSAGQPMDVVPLKIFINPKMKILDHTTTSYPENCASICGFSAHVPRAKSLEIEALDLDGKLFKWKAEGWPAKIAQHEMDHLQGKVFTDRMNPQTFSCAIWDVVNTRRGKVQIKFVPDVGTFSEFKKIFYK